MHQQDEEKEASGLRTALDSLRDHIIVRTQTGAKLLQSYLDLGGSLADFPHHAELIKAFGGAKPSFRVIDGGGDATAAPAPKTRGPKKGSKKKAAKKAPPREAKPAKAPKKGKKKAAKASAVNDVAAKVLEVLGKADQPMAVSDVATAAGIGGKEAAVALKALREHKKVKSIGKARGTRWSAK